MDLLALLGLSALGGLALNLSPCILPTIPLKVLNFLHIAQNSKIHAIIHSALYCLGIVASFLLLALLVIGIQYAGGFAHWGMQFQSPWFCASLGLITGLLGLKLVGAARWVQALKRSLNIGQKKGLEFKIGWWDRLKSSTIEKIGGIKKKLPYLGSFLHGLLTTAIGSACCGPILGYVMGMALAMPAITVLAVFALAGLGMALPYMILGCLPALLKRLPRTGRWTKVIEIVAGIGMLLTSLWFFWLI